MPSSSGAVPRRVLTLNGGSSSIKFALFEQDGGEPRRRMAGQVERLGSRAATLRISLGGDAAPRAIAGSDPAAAIAAAGDAIAEAVGEGESAGGSAAVAAVVHRIVHGGATLVEPREIDDAVLAELRKLAAIDPDHLPAEIKLIEAAAKRFPGVPQIACFDTAFHRDLPAVAKTLAIPRHWSDAGVRRYGFHGLSYEFLLAQLGRIAGESAGRGRVILAHLGNGASLAAVRDGRPIDTTMSFTPTAGLVMGTRCGDVDPGVLLYLMRSASLTVDQVDAMVNRESGLAGISGAGPDMRDLLARQGSDERAALAIEIFCYQAKKFIAAMAAALGGVDTLVFSAGIGEHLPAIRAGICRGLEFIGIELDAAANEGNASIISRAGGRVTVRVIPTDEEVILARAGFGFLEGKERL